MAELWSAPRSFSELSAVVKTLTKLEDMLRRVTGWYIQPRRVDDDTTLLGTDRLLLVDTTSDDVTVALPPAGSFIPQPYTVKLVAGSNNVTLDADGSELIYTTSGNGTLQWNTTGDAYTVVPCLVSAPGTWGWIVTN